MQVDLVAKTHIIELLTPLADKNDIKVVEVRGSIWIIQAEDYNFSVAGISLSSKMAKYKANYLISIKITKGIIVGRVLKSRWFENRNEIEIPLADSKCFDKIIEWANIQIDAHMRIINHDDFTGH